MPPVAMPLQTHDGWDRVIGQALHIDIAKGMLRREWLHRACAPYTLK
jgi:hypothetical protein